MRIKNSGKYSLRGLGVFCVVYGVGLLIFGKSAGMSPIWFVLGAICIGLSFSMVFVKKWVRVLSLAIIAAVVMFAAVILAYGYGIAPEADSDYVIVLGAKVDGEVPSRTLQYRLDTTYEYLNTHPDTKAILSGGQGADEDMSEAQAMFRFLAAHGIDKVRLILEEESTSTYENLRNSFALVGDDESLKLTIITSDFHVLRATMIATKLGRQVNGIGAKTSLPLVPNYLLREMIAVLKEIV